MTTRRQQIIAALEARLAQITTANGFQTNAGQHVFLGKDPEDLFGDELTRVPCCALNEGEAVVEQKIGTHYRVSLPIVVCGITNAQPDAPSTAGNALLADLTTALWPEAAERGVDNDDIGGLAISWQYTGDEIFPRGPGRTFTVAMVTGILEFKFRPGAPGA